MRGAGARLIDVHDELIAQRAAEHLVGSPHDGVGDIRVEPPSAAFASAAAFLIEDRGGDELGVGAQAADRKVLERAQRLDAVVGVGGDGRSPRGSRSVRS